MVNNFDKSLEGLFTGELNKYTVVFNKVKRSDFGTGYKVFKKIIEHKGEFCFVPPKTECFRKCTEFIFKKDFSQQYCEVIQHSYRSKQNKDKSKM